MSNQLESSNMTLRKSLLRLSSTFGTAFLIQVAPICDTYESYVPGEMATYRSLVGYFSTETNASVHVETENHEVNQAGTIRAFAEKMYRNSEELDGDLLKVVEENFWDWL